MNKTILTILIVVILVGILFYINRGGNNNNDYNNNIMNNLNNNDNNDNSSNKFNTDITLRAGDGVTLGTLKINFKRVSLPPDSFTGNKAEYTFANMEVVEEGDAFNFSLHSTKNTNQVFHEYEVLLKDFKPQENQVTILVEQKPIAVKVKEIDAVKTALVEARKTNLSQPEVLNRSLKNGVWEMEVGFGMGDIYLIVKIDAESGKVLETIKQNRV